MVFNIILAVIGIIICFHLHMIGTFLGDISKTIEDWDSVTTNEENSD